MRVEWITYKGKRILSVDYTGLSEADMIKQLEYESGIIMKEKEPVLYMGNFTNTVLSSPFVNKATEWGKITEKNTRKGALIGITGMKAVLLNTYNMLTGGKMKPFPNEEAAKEHLAKD